jgi:hypothetical protein
MLVAFLGADGMSTPTYAALLAAQGFSALGRRAKILSVGMEPDSPILAAQRIANSIHEVERGSDMESFLDAAQREHEHVILVSSVSQFSWLLSKDCTCVIVVEPTRAHEVMAMTAIQSMTDAIAVLRWGHADHSAAIARVADAFRDIGVKVLAAAVPALNRRETDALLEGQGNIRVTRIGVELALALIKPTNLIEARFDERGLSDRLRELADDMEAIEEGVAPTEQDLMSAPVLTGWSQLPQQVPVIAGIVAGHPSLQNFIMTSQVYASDGRTWVRTLSRWYRLGPPTAEPDTSPLH